MANALLHVPDFDQYDLSSLVMINLGGAAPSVELVQAMQERFGCEVFTGYGLSETTPVLTMARLKAHLKDLPPDERYRRQAMTGLELPGVDLRVVDEEGRDVPNDGEHLGEIIVRSDVVMKGYWRQPEETARVIRHGWFHTGDIATIDEEHYVLIVDRKKDLIISGGENISSIEVEKALASHPAVFECAVVPVPDEKWGEVPHAFVVLKPDQQLSAAELLNYCRSRLAHFKVPKSVDFTSELPKSGTGKILKRQLKEHYWRGYDRRIH
jgi:fatty-acyl-CoA synthase